MKLSNKILAGFFGLIFLYLLAAFTELRIKGENIQFDDKDAVVETLPLDSIKYLQISDLDKRITISSSLTPYLELRSSAGELLGNLNYEVRGDTLHILKFDNEPERPYQINLFVRSPEFSGMNLINASVLIKDLDLPVLSIKQSGGHLIMEPSLRFQNLNIDSRNAQLNVTQIQIDNVSAHLNSSNLYLRSQVKKLEGSIVNNSMLLLTGSGEINIKKDETSMINWIK